MLAIVQSQVSLLAIITLLGAAHGLFIAFFLLKKKIGNRKAHLFLALILIGFSLQIYDYFMFATGLIFQYPSFSFLGYGFTTTYAPLLFFFVKSIASKKNEFSTVDFIHFTPAFIHLIYGLITYHFNKISFKIEYLTFYKSSIDFISSGGNYSTLIVSFYSFVSIHLAIYIYLSHKKINLFKSESHKYNSYDFPKSVKWIRLVMISVVFTWLMVTSNLVHILTGVFLSNHIGFFSLIILSGIIYYLSYFIINNPEVFKPLTLSIEKKYQSSSLKKDQKEVFLNKLESYIKSYKPYLNNELTISELAKKLEIQPKHLSQLINEHFHKNFYEFINYYRIEEAKNMLVDSSMNHYSILGIGLETGFKSKSSFNTAFKKFTGITPSQYKSSLNKY